MLGFNVLLKIVAVMAVLNTVDGSSCTRDTVVGSMRPDKIPDRIDSKSGQLFMVRANSYLVSCCGSISEWKLFIKKPGTIRFQIWRGLGTGEYELVGENLATYNRGEEDNLFIVQVPAEQQIPVKEGDFIGWFNKDESMVGYSKAKSGLGALIMSSRKPVIVGDVIDWSGVKSTEPRSYGITATLTKVLKPQFKNLDEELVIESSLEPGTEIYQLGFEGVDGIVVPKTFAVFMDSYSEYFDYNQSINSVYITETPPPGKYVLEITVKDHCGNSDSGKLKVNVKAKLPSILNLPAAVSVREDARHEETLLLAIEVAQSGPIACDIKSIEPTTGEHLFVLRNINESIHEIYLKATAELDYHKEHSYELSIKCSAGRQSDIESLFIDVIPNHAPNVTNLPASVEIYADMNIIGNSIFHVTSDDKENNPVFYNATCDPKPCPFSISKSGSVVVTEDIRTADAYVYYIEVMVSDFYNSAGPEILIVNISGINKPPFIYNLPEKAMVSLVEDSPPMTSIFQIKAIDQDVNDTIMYSFTAKPSSMIPLFAVNESTGTVFALTPFDYEGLKFRSIKLLLSASDGLSRDEGVLKVMIIDINEAPRFTYSNYTVITKENKPGYNVAKGLVLAKDFDKKDTVSYSLDCGSDTYLFRINNKNADISQNYELDVDDLGVEEREIVCDVTAADKFGMTSHAFVHLTVKDENDNSPEFEKTSFLFVVTRDLPIFSIIGQARATDKDVAPENKRLFFQFTEEIEDFVIDENGTLYLTKDLSDVGIGTLYKYTITVQDTKRTKDSVPITIVVLPGEYKTLVVSVEAKVLTFWSLPENVAWFVTAIHLGVLLLALMILMSTRAFVCTLKVRKHGNNNGTELLLHDKNSLKEIVQWNNLNKTRESPQSSKAPTPQVENPSFRHKNSIHNASTESKPNENQISTASEQNDRRSSRCRSTDDLDKKPRQDEKSKNNTATEDGVFTTMSSADVASTTSRLALSKIETTETEQAFTWKPWAVSDFKNFYMQNVDSKNGPDKRRSTPRKQPLSQRQI